MINPSRDRLARSLEGDRGYRSPSNTTAAAGPCNEDGNARNITIFHRVTPETLRRNHGHCGWPGTDKPRFRRYMVNTNFLLGVIDETNCGGRRASWNCG